MTLLGGFAGAVAEALPLDIDDNFSIPVVSGFIMWAGFLLIQFL
jgi:dolichol kinase